MIPAIGEAILIIFGVAASLQLSGCEKKDGGLPPLPDSGDDTGDVGDDEDQTDPDVEALDELEVVDEDIFDTSDVEADTAPDTVPDSLDIIDEDTAEADAADGVDEDGDEDISDGDALDVEEEEVTLPDDYYSCTVTATDSYGMSYVASAVSNEPVLYAGGNWSGTMWFAGSPAGLVAARINNAAFTWPQSGQFVPLYAQNLTATYEAQLAIAGGSATFSLASYPAGSSSPAAFTILPMTWAAIDGSAEPIAPDTSNEIYTAADPLLEIAVNSTDGYATFAGGTLFGDTDWTITNPDYLSSVDVSCERL